MCYPVVVELDGHKTKLICILLLEKYVLYILIVVCSHFEMSDLPCEQIVRMC